MADVKLTVDGIPVEVPRGTNILEAAKKAGIEVPNFCYHPRLRSFGACRMCIVEVAGRSNELYASCATPVREDMQVFTNTDRVQEGRRTLLQFFLVDHPVDCPVCDKSGECDLQRYSFQYGLGVENPFVRPKNRQAIEHLSPTIDIKRDRCVLCAQCWRVCDELVGARALTFANRGIDMIVDAKFARGLGETDCVNCGLCITVCPVGSLLDATAQDTFRSWELQTTSTTCGYCAVGCKLFIQSEAGKVLRVVGKKGPWLNDEQHCAQGRFGYQFVHSPDRLTTPLIKRGGMFVEASWDEALDYTASALKQYQGDQFGLIGSTRITNEDNYLLQKFARRVMDTNNIDTDVRLTTAPAITAFERGLGDHGAMTNGLTDLMDSGCLLLVGSNISDTLPVMSYFLQRPLRYGSMKLIVAHPRRIPWVEFAHLWLRLRPGTELALSNGLAKIILDEGLADEAFIAARTEGFEAWKAALAAYTPERVSAITGVPVADLQQAARLYARGGLDDDQARPEAGYPGSAILTGDELTQLHTGTDSVGALLNLALATGNLGRRGAGVNVLKSQNNTQGASDVGALPDYLPGYQPVADPEARARFQAAWAMGGFDRSITPLPAEPGLTLTGMLDQALAGNLRALYVAGHNPVRSVPGSDRVLRALQALDFLVVQDIFMTETAQLADVVLPATSFAEKEGTFTNTERRVQVVRRAVEPEGWSLQDWEIVQGLANRLGYPVRYSHPSEIMEEIARVSPIYGGISHQKLGEEGVQWPCPSAEHPGTPVLYTESFPRGRARFVAVDYRPPAEEPDADYPLVLTIGRSLYQHGTGSMTRRCPALNSLDAIGEVEINPADASRYGIGDDDCVRVSSRRGEVRARARLTGTSPEGMVYLPLSFAEVPVFQVVNRVPDPASGTPEAMVCAVQLTKDTADA